MLKNAKSCNCVLPVRRCVVVVRPCIHYFTKKKEETKIFIILFIVLLFKLMSVPHLFRKNEGCLIITKAFALESLNYDVCVC